MTDLQQLIANAIHDYCEGINHLEFNKSDFPQMTNEIIHIVENNAAAKRTFGNITEES